MSLVRKTTQVVGTNKHCYPFLSFMKYAGSHTFLIWVSVKDQTSDKNRGSMSLTLRYSRK